MKLKTTLKASLVVLGSALALHAQTPTATPPAAPAPAAAPQFTEAQLLEAYGWFIGKRMGASELEFTKEQTEAIIKGIVLAAEGKELGTDMNTIGPKVEEFLQAKNQQYMNKLKAKNDAESATFLAGVKARKGVVTLPSGLMYEVVQPGSGEFPKAADTVKVHYTGTLINGTKFDSSVDRGEPAEFALNEVIPGWTEGIQKINKGGKIKLYIPANLAYGDMGRPNIPPGSALVFDVELLDVKSAPAADTAPLPQPPAAK